jgi:hypothetical protein
MGRSAAMPYLEILATALGAIFFYRAAVFEMTSPLLWTALSILISILTLFVFRWGLLGCLLGQAGLFVGIALFRMVRVKS